MAPRSRAPDDIFRNYSTARNRLEDFVKRTQKFSPVFDRFEDHRHLSELLFSIGSSIPELGDIKGRVALPPKTDHYYFQADMLLKDALFQLTTGLARDIVGSARTGSTAYSFLRNRFLILDSFYLEKELVNISYYTFNDTHKYVDRFCALLAQLRGVGRPVSYVKATKYIIQGLSGNDDTDKHDDPRILHEYNLLRPHIKLLTVDEVIRRLLLIDT